MPDDLTDIINDGQDILADPPITDPPQGDPGDETPPEPPAPPAAPQPTEEELDRLAYQRLQARGHFGQPQVTQPAPITPPIGDDEFLDQKQMIERTAAYTMQRNAELTQAVWQAENQLEQALVGQPEEVKQAARGALKSMNPIQVASIPANQMSKIVDLAIGESVRKGTYKPVTTQRPNAVQGTVTKREPAVSAEAQAQADAWNRRNPPHLHMTAKEIMENA